MTIDHRPRSNDINEHRLTPTPPRRAPRQPERGVHNLVRTTAPPLPDPADEPTVDDVWHSPLILGGVGLALNLVGAMVASDHGFASAFGTQLGVSVGGAISVHRIAWWLRDGLTMLDASRVYCVFSFLAMIGAFFID